MMRGMLAQLSPSEEGTLLRIGFGADGDLDQAHLRRLLQLDLVEWSGWAWRLTTLGRRRYEGLVVRDENLKPAA
jgi:hypothetical protein